MAKVKRCKDCIADDSLVETWMPVPDFEDRYEVSDKGRVRSLDIEITDRLGRTRRQPGRIKKTWYDRGGYEMVELSRDGQRFGLGVHRLVALAFTPPEKEGLEVMHLDHDPTHNHLSNLKWGTHSENVKATVKDGRHRSGNHDKTHCPRGHTYSHRNKRGDRVCSVCRRDAQRRYRARKKANVD